ncbi:IBR domain-containing protein [Coprinopsis cinerea okayama7|uniref:RBR-type E3 ubiquitin transferase n=1 Tax=Coprinopsis cinerea (strain Okayama-7 / 130 / ATCC MYA-4618 / FGSC 9003) TaxID=240176 RepID=A8NK54_COPC7|nr:IBR domain-containing protein [Coprinopsis cinerea okayama7\|eukprot:XP_001834354.2 IBR domain-containing protein [Coprinopsis cinerea okayama7\
MASSEPSWDLTAATDAIDLETALLIAQLQLEDALEISAGFKGKGKANAPPSDQEIAVTLLSEEIKAWKQIHEDATLARSVNRAMGTDADILEAFRLAEESAAADRRAAEVLQRQGRLPPPTQSQRIVGEDKAFPNRFKEVKEQRGSAKTDLIKRPIISASTDKKEAQAVTGLYGFVTSSVEERTAGPSVDRYKRVACVSCDDKHRIGSMLKSSCNGDHYWCSACLASVIEVFLRDESLYPLRCCQTPLAKDDVSYYLNNPSLFRRFEEKMREYDVPTKDRVYCSTPTCSAFLGSALTLRGATLYYFNMPASTTCRSCSGATCIDCRKPAHRGDTCTQNETVAQLRALAREVGWQTCPGCSAVVELHHGCNHMTCRCRTQFCYACGVEWKNCRCPQWEEERLLATAQVRAENVMGAQARQAQPVNFAQQVQRAVDNLRVNHGCTWHRWSSRSGGGVCEECGDYLPVYLKVRPVQLYSVS